MIQNYIQNFVSLIPSIVNVQHATCCYHHILQMIFNRPALEVFIFIYVAELYKMFLIAR